MPEDPFFRGLFGRHRFAEREICAYNDILSPHCQDGGSDAVAPRALASKIATSGQDFCIILEDLTADGYDMIDWRAGLDNERGQLRAAVETLARFHAGTRKLIETTGEETWVERLSPNSSMQNELHKELEYFLTNGISYCEEILDESTFSRLSRAVPRIIKTIKGKLSD